MFQENPSFAELAAGYDSCAGASLEGLRMDVQKQSRFNRSKCARGTRCIRVDMGLHPIPLVTSEGRHMTAASDRQRSKGFKRPGVPSRCKVLNMSSGDHLSWL